jgi:hypothetical protein
MAANCVKIRSTVCFGLVRVLSRMLAILCLFRRRHTPNDLEVAAVRWRCERGLMPFWPRNKWLPARCGFQKQLVVPISRYVLSHADPPAVLEIAEFVSQRLPTQ